MSEKKKVGLMELARMKAKEEIKPKQKKDISKKEK